MLAIQTGNINGRILSNGGRTFDKEVVQAIPDKRGTGTSRKLSDVDKAA